MARLIIIIRRISKTVLWEKRRHDGKPFHANAQLAQLNSHPMTMLLDVLQLYGFNPIFVLDLYGTFLMIYYDCFELFHLLLPCSYTSSFV